MKSFGARHHILVRLIDYLLHLIVETAEPNWKNRTIFSVITGALIAMVIIIECG